MKYTITYFNNGGKKIKTDDGVETWYDSKDQFHRADGPAITRYYTDIDVNYRSKTYLERMAYVKGTWYWHGVKIDADSLEQFQQLVKFIAFI